MKTIVRRQTKVKITKRAQRQRKISKQGFGNFIWNLTLKIEWSNAYFLCALVAVRIRYWQHGLI